MDIRRKTATEDNGFTLIELLLVISIIALITIFVFNTLATFRRQSDIDGIGEGVLETLRMARSRTLSSQNASGYGVHFESATYTLFTGRIYSASSASNIDYLLPDSVEIFSIALSTSTQSVIFERLTGQTSTTGTIGIRSVGEPAKARIIKVDGSGTVSLESASIASLNTRITDTRHLHFDLGWSIQNATTLRLIFLDPPNPAVVNDIAMAPPAPRDVFSWEGDTDVNGQNQHIAVSAHSLDASNTLLSIQRHADRNNKSVLISIVDGIDKPIVLYDVSGAATVQMFGGTMIVQ